MPLVWKAWQRSRSANPDTPPLVQPDGTTIVLNPVTGILSATGAGSVSKYSTSFAAVSSLTVTHGLGTTAVEVSVYDGSGFEIVPGSVQVVDANTVQIEFGISTTGSVVVMG